MKTPLLGALAVVLLAAAALPACAAPQLAVTGYQLQATKRISATVYEYSYRVTAVNRGSAAMGAEAQVAALRGWLTPTQGSLYFGKVGAGQSVTSADTFRIRHDRRYKFTEADIRWTFSASDASFTGRFTGPATGTVASAIVNYVDDTPYAPTAVDTDAEGQKVLRTDLTLDVAPGATVGQLQPALDAVGATVIGTLAGRNLILVRVPDPGSLSALEVLRARLAAVPAVRAVDLSVFPKPAELPQNPAFQPQSPSYAVPEGPVSDFLAHQVAVRAPAAWNIRERIDARNAGDLSPAPLLVLIDYFGDGAPTAADGYNVLTTPHDYAPRSAQTDLSFHGYGVLGMVAASYGGSNDSAELATGMLPLVNLPLVVRAVDMTHLGWEQASLKVVALLQGEANGRPVVLSTSLAWGPVNCHNGVCAEASDDEKCRTQVRAAKWIRLIRGDAATAVSLEPRFLHVAAAGNNPRAQAVDLSIWAVAELQAQVPDTDACALRSFGRVGGLHNILVAEGRYAQAGTPGVPPLTGCPNGILLEDGVGSFTPGGTISGIGSVSRGLLLTGDGRLIESNPGIFLPFAAERIKPDVASSFKVGSSYATPQVAGAAILAWSLRPDLSPQDIKDTLLNTAMRNQATGASTPSTEIEPPDVGCPGPSGYHPTVDAYAALLASDGDHGTLDLADRGLKGPTARLALLDVAKVVDGKLAAGPDGAFTQADILFFLQQFEARRGALDYSRYDINGDGHTGEAYVGLNIIERRRFDLDGNGSWTNAAGQVENHVLDFDEYAPADIGVLAYYAYSPLYTGNEYERALLLLPYLDRMNNPGVFLSGLGIAVTGIQSTNLELKLIDLQGSSFKSGCATGERGNYSAAPAQAASQAYHADAVFWAPVTQGGRIADELPNAPNCSAFIATVPGSGRMWINSASRTTEEAKGRDVEYQTRIYLGEPDLAAAHAGRITPPDGRLRTQALSYGVVDKPGGSFRELAKSTRDFKLEGVTMYEPPS